MGWELRYFWASVDALSERSRLLTLLGIENEYFREEKRTDGYVELSRKGIGIKFRGNGKNLECKILKEITNGFEKWDKYSLGSSRIDNISIASSVKDSKLGKTNEELVERIKTLDLNRNIIFCHKTRITAPILLERTKLSIPPVFANRNFGFVELAYFSLERLNTENLGNYFSINFEGSSDSEAVKFVAEAIVNTLKLSPIYCMGYPEFLM